MNDQKDMISEHCCICDKETIKFKYAAACPKCLQTLEKEFYKEKANQK